MYATSTPIVPVFPIRNGKQPLREVDILQVMRTTGMDYIQARNHLLARQQVRNLSPVRL